MKEKERILHTEYSDIMQKSYIDYAMSVIISRALPDVRDGLKPVQRRTLYDMYELGIRYDKPYRKCARIVGDTMGKYHPHGDSSIYEALVVMAQDFKKELPLVDGHGNFGSIEGDGAAAMRYTEARLQKVTQDTFLADLDKNVVNFVPNFDETEKEPEVLPVRIPNLLVNGSDGIAVGMATSIPPHNLGEVIDMVKAYMKNDSLTTKDLLSYLKGPDFPTGGIVTNQDELEEIYETGQGKIRIRGKVTVEKGKNGRQHLVITEIPYPMIGANIGKFLNDIYELTQTRKTTDITDISNQSSKEGIRIVLELKKGADIEQLENLLYTKTRLEDTFGVNMLAVVNGRPETLSLKKILDCYLDFQFEINDRKYRTLLAKEEEQKEIQEGLIKACDCIDLIIEILRGSQDLKQAKACLTQGTIEGIHFKTKKSAAAASKLRFTDRQADAILQMRLYKLIGLEIQSLQKEYEQTLKKIASYEEILENHDSMAKVIIKELDQIKKAYSKPRKTEICNVEEAVYVEKEPEKSEVVILIDRFGYAKSIDVPTYERNQEAADAENRSVIFCLNTDYLALFTDTGRLHLLKVTDLPFGRFREKGVPLDNLCHYDSAKERILCMDALSSVLKNNFLFVSCKGNLKIVAGSEFDTKRKDTSATKLNEEDKLKAVLPYQNEKDLVLGSKKGYFIRFETSEIPQQKKGAVGVRGIRLTPEDQIDQVSLVKNVSEESIDYHGQKIAPSRIRLTKRDTKGTKLKFKNN